MKTNKLTIWLIAACCFVISVCSGSQGMDTPLQPEENSPCNNMMCEQSCLQNEDNALDLEPIPSKLIKQEDPPVSWASYLLSPAKAVIQSTYEVMNYANKYPSQALFFGLYIACQPAMADPILACMMYLYDPTVIIPVMVNFTMGNCASCVPILDTYCRKSPACVEQGYYYYACTPVISRQL